MIYILLPVHNRVKTTEVFIQSLQKQLYKEFELIVIDDGSSDGTDVMVKKYFPESTIIKGNGNLWWAGSLQKGYDFLKNKESCDTDIVLTINDDVTFEEDFLNNAVNELFKYKKTALLARAEAISNACHIDQGVHIDWKTFEIRQANNCDEINCLSTRGLFLYLNDFINSKGFHPNILPHYFSDYEFTIRLQRQGVRLLSSSLVRLKFDSTTTGERDIKRGPFLFVLKQLFTKRHVLNPIPMITFIMLSAPWRRKIPLVLLSVKNMKRLIKNSIKKVSL